MRINFRVYRIRQTPLWGVDLHCPQCCNVGGSCIGSFEPLDSFLVSRGIAMARRRYQHLSDWWESAREIRKGSAAAKCHFD